MSSLDARRKRQDLEIRAQAAEEKVKHDSGSHAQLQAAILAAELYMQALRIADNPRDKKRLDTKTKELINKAEELKESPNIGNGQPRPVSRSNAEHPASTRKLTTREHIILLEGSKLNGAVFKPWVSPPSDEEFELQDGQEPYVDSSEYSLSAQQVKHFDGWQRPKEALARVKVVKDGQILSNDATMVKLGTSDMVQDVAPDCSVVASFCVGSATAEKGHRKIFSNIVWPYDHREERPIMSANGKYVLRLYFNGCWRRVDIDDRLPTSKTSRVLHVLDRSHPGLIWPAIAEKAYLKVRGGYDFPGSNSGTDLAVLTGWIPQQIFLHDEDMESRRLWNEMHTALQSGEIMVTLGTGKLGRREQQILGLAAEHDYAVLEMKETEDSREMLIKNPWADGDIWKGATRCRPNPGHESDSPNSPLVGSDVEEMKPGTFWMGFDRVFQYFEHMYVNWDPGLFREREDMHFSWQLPEVVPAGHLLIDNPQFAVKVNRAGEVWILLNRHFRTGDYSVENHGKNGYISLYLFEKHGGTVFSSESAKVKGPFVDSPNTLLRFEAEARQTYTIVVVSQNLPPGKHNFTISAFTNSHVVLSEAFKCYNNTQQLLAAWTRSTAGGNADSPRYLQNPQFTLEIGGETRAALVLKTLSGATETDLDQNLHVKILITASDGRRITKLRQRDVTAHSGDYKRGGTVVETMLSPGKYTVICSTFEHNQLSKFQLDLHASLSQSQAKFRPLAAEGTGRLSIFAQPAIFVDGVSKLVAPLKIEKVTEALFRASLSRGPGSALFKISLEQGQGPYKRTIATSASEETSYSAISAGLRIDDLDLNASMASNTNGGLWLVVERRRQSSSEAYDVSAVQVEVLTEERIEIGQWAPLED